MWYYTGQTKTLFIPALVTILKSDITTAGLSHFSFLCPFWLFVTRHGWHSWIEDTSVRSVIYQYISGAQGFPDYTRRDAAKDWRDKTLWRKLCVAFFSGFNFFYSYSSADAEVLSEWWHAYFSRRMQQVWHALSVSIKARLYSAADTDMDSRRSDSWAVIPVIPLWSLQRMSSWRTIM